ncbi:MAG: C_GCAxxG_C_C family protein [Eubacterium sp.]|nr:C_GCAxxG_C_C family protein [Eubacterium sp.]
MSERGEKAKQMFLSGYNCAQSVLIAFSDMTGLDEKTSALIASGFGGGIGRMREVCGTLCGAFMAAGIINGYDMPADFDNKARTYKMIQELAARFKEKNGSIICKELLGLSQPEHSYIPEKRTDEYYKKRPCPELAKQAAKILEEYLKNLAADDSAVHIRKG